MELELGLKITRTREDVSSSVDFRFSKDPFGPLVLSRETDSRFIIIIHIKGFKKEGIEIEINKEGNRITIRGRKPVEEIVLIRWMAWRKEVELRAFKKVFLIPDIVDLDKIKARFDDDDATLTITMPKRVKGISGFKLEEEEEESVDFGDVSETQNKEEVEEDNVEREELDEDSEIQREEEFGDIMEEKETESQVFEGEEKGFSGDLDEEENQIEDDDLEKIQQVDEQDKILEFAGEETVGRQEWADSNTESEDSSLKKLPDITEQENNQEVMEKQVETKSEGTESKAVEEIEEQEPDEQSKGGATEKKTTSDDGDGLSKVQGIEEPERHSEERKIQDMAEGKGEEEKTKIVRKKSKVQGIEEPERHNEESKIQEMVEEKTGGQEKKEIVTMEIKKKDAEEECDGKMGEGFKPYIERTQVVAEDDTAETETKAEEFESEKPDADEVDKKHELVEKKEEEEENASVRRKSEDGSLIKLQENEEQHSKGRKRQDEQKNIKDLVEEKTPDAETITANGQRELANSNTESEDSSLRNLPDIIEQEDSQEVMDKQVSKVESKSDANGSRAAEEIEEQESDALDRTSRSREMEKKTTDGDDDGLSKVQGIEERNYQEIVDEETGGQENRNTVTMDAREEFDRKMGEGFTPNVEKTRVVGEDDIAETETKAEEFESEKPEEDEVDKKYELVEKKEEEEENANVRRKSEDRSLIKLPENEEQHPKGTKRKDKQENIKELVEEKTPKAETKTANDVPKPVQEIEAPEVDTFGKTDVEGKEEKEKKKSVKMEIENGDAKEEVDAKMVEGFTPSIAETETKAEEFEPHKLEPDEVDDTHKLVEKKEGEEDNAKVRRQSEDKSVIELQENEKQHSKGQKREEKTAETETNIPKPVRETAVPEVDTLGKTGNEGKEGKEKKKSVTKEIKNGYPKEEVDAKNGKGFAPNTAETETRPEEFQPQKLEPHEVDEIHQLVEKKKEEEDNAKVKRQSEDSSLVKKLQETEEQQFQRQKRHNKQEKVKELLQEKTPAAETNIANQIPKPVQVIEEPEVDTLETGGEKEISETEAKEQDSYRPKTLGELEKIQKLAEEKTDFLKNRKVQEEEEISEKKTEFGDDDDDHISRNVGNIEQGDSDAKEEVDAGVGKGFTPDIAETETESAEFESDKVKADEVDKIHELVEKKKKKKKKEEEEENDQVRKQSEDTSLKRLQEQNFHGPNLHNKQEKIKELVEEKPVAETNIANENSKPVQETEKPEVDTIEKCVDREFSEMETMDQESFRPKILEGEDKIQELDEEKTNVSRKVEGEEETAEKKTELGEDDMSRKIRDIEQRDSDAMKGEEEKEKSQELVLEEKVSDGGKGIVTEAIEENDESRKVQETEEKHPHEEDKRGNQFQKLIRGETSGYGEVQDVENEKKTTEAEKRVRDSEREAQEIVRTDSDVSGKYGKGETFQELPENRTTYQNEQEEDKESEADRPQKITGAIEQELVYLNSQVDQDNVEDGEATRDPVDDKTNDCKEEESATKTNDVVRKVEGIKEQELFEPKRDHVRKINEMVEEIMAESEIEAEFGGLSKVHDTEEQELHEPNIHKERDKTKINGREEPSVQEKEDEENEKIVESMTITEKENSTNADDIREERPDEPESHEKQYRVQAGHNGHKEEQKDEKLSVKAKGETEEDSSKKVQESDGIKRSIVQDKNQETKEKEITKAMKEKKIVERRTKIEDGSWRKVEDDEDPELTKPYKRQEDKTPEPLETGTSDYRKKVKKQDGSDTLRSQEHGKPNLEEFEKFSEQRNVPKFVDEERMENIAKPGGGLEDDDSAKFHEFEERKSDEDWICEEREKMKDLVKEEAIDPKDKHTGEAGHNDHKEEEQEEMVIAKAELKAKEDSSEKVQETENKKSDELQRSVVRDKMQETEEKDKTRAMEENEIVEGRIKTKDGSLRKVREGEEDPELGRHKTYEEEDRSPELLEADTSDHREKSKKQVGDDILRSQETGKLDLGELERQRKQRKIHQPVQDEKGERTMENISEPRGKMVGDSSGKFHESQKQKSYEDWRQEEGEEIEDLFKEEATDPKDKHTGGKEEHEEERYQKVPQAKTKAEDEVNKKVGDNKKEEENLVGDSTTMIQETEKEESHKSDIHEKLDIVQDFVEDETGDQGDERTGGAAVVVANNEKDSSKKLHSREGEELKEPDEHKEHDEIHETSDPKVKESDGERVSEKETKEQEAHVQQLEGKPENFKDDDVEARRGKKGKQGKTVEAKSDELKKRGTSNHEVELVTEDDSLRKGQDFLENESSNVSKGRPVEQEKNQQVEKREDEEKPVVETETNADKSRKHETQELVESEENEELKKIRKPMEEKTNAPEKEKGKEGNEKIAEERMQGKIDIRMKDQDTKRQEPYELLEDEGHGKIPEPIVEGTKHQREEEKRMAKSEDISSIKVQKIKAEESAGLEKHRKLSTIQENQSLEEKIPEPGEKEEEDNEGGEYKAVLKKKSMEDSSHSQDVEENGSDQRERYAEEEKIQEPMVEEEGKEDYDIREGEQNEKEKRIQQVESKANDDSSKKNEKETRLPQVESKANDDISKKNEKEKRIPQVESKANDDSSKKNEKEKRIPQVESKANDDSLKNNESGRLRRQKQIEDHQELGEIEKSDQRKEEKEEKIVGKGVTTDHEYKIHEHEEGKSGSLTKEETSNDKEENRGNRAGAERKIRDDGFEEEELAIVVRHREQDKKQSFVGKDTNGKAKENKNHETKSREDSSRKTHENEQQESHQQKRNNEEQEKKNQGTHYCRYEEDGKEDKQIAEAEGQRKLKGIEEQGRIKELVEDKTHYCRETEFEDGSSKKTPEIDKEELTEPGRDEKRDEIEEPVDRETSEDEEEELEVEVEDSEEDWEAEVIQEMDSDEDNDKIRKIRKIKLGFRLVGGSTLFMSLIVIVISFIRSKRKIRCYKF